MSKSRKPHENIDFIHDNVIIIQPRRFDFKKKVCYFMKKVEAAQSEPFPIARFDLVAQ